ncbi:prephenate dehydrogenase/arogenate dehydrogenase family protein [Neokomagataea anthophila]|uniref:Prephenate dehydrogenase/arogenate dehydrogenase family protein n=1 Tax=Neokomagataea anthophila TaxID=2826925 RepID=A0ABS5E769_9PROT|nr:prephenate dehydrogenase/arogenate dehydrogenase family protein [Neokomagataea anthophila]MBR0559757.1 prephenate dehydrogenase/arogenate dehydrogenase family protein [Neokomagataea anthophila]
MPLFKNLMVVGPGLIGSSILRRARGDGQLAERLIVMDRDIAVLKRVQELGLADHITLDPADAAQADCVILSVPVRAIEPVARSLAPYLQPGTILTDVASVRGELGAIIPSFLPDGVEYVPSHPMAGTEFSGPDAGFAELFEGRWALLIPSLDAPEWACTKIQHFWESCGARTKVLTAEDHDRICAMVSHLPHLLAFTICDTADNLSAEMRSAVLDYAASGFRDFTRIAASDPIMWRDIFSANRDVLLETLERFIQDTQSMADAIRRGDDEAITAKINRGRRIRRTLIHNKQA